MNGEHISPSDRARDMYQLATKLFPYCRSITGEGVRQTLSDLTSYIDKLNITEIPSGTQVFDWTIPLEWKINDAYIMSPSGEKILDFKNSNLHVVSYSDPIDTKILLTNLKDHIYSLPDQPHAIPYVTSYYKRTYGFCMSDEQKKRLLPGEYKIKIDSSFKEGSLTYADAILPGESENEVLISTYICHPSMANNELSGPVVATELYKWLSSLKNRKYTYRFVFVPETIGAIAYIANNLNELKKKVKAGFVLTCLGDDYAYSFLPSKEGNTLTDRIALHTLKHLAPGYKNYSYLDRASDERQYCSAGVDLPVALMMRSKFSEFDEYHTSLDNLDFISPEGLLGGFTIHKRAIEALELNCTLKTLVKGEPQLGKRGLYDNLSIKTNFDKDKLPVTILNILAYANEKRDLLEIADILNTPIWELDLAMSYIIKFELATRILK